MSQPDISSALALLTHLDTEELKEILNNETKFEVILKDVKQLGTAEKDMVIASNRSLVEYNLSLKPEIEKAKREVMSLTEQVDTLSKQIKEKLDEYKKKSAGFSAESTLAVLQTAAAESEEASENIAQEFIKGDINVEEFLEKFSPERTKMHLRKVKVEKMTELLRNGRVTSDRGNLPYPSLPVYPHIPSTGGAVPYPVGPISMPMPGLYGNHF